jgi:hypothetical protein
VARQAEHRLPPAQRDAFQDHIHPPHTEEQTHA